MKAPVLAYVSSRLLVLALSAGAGLSIPTVAEHFGPATTSWLFLLQAWSRPEVRAPDERFGFGVSTGDPEIDAGLALLLAGTFLFFAFVLFQRWAGDRRALLFFAVAPTTCLLSAANWDSLFLLLALGAFLVRGPSRWALALAAVALRGAGLALVAGLLGDRLSRRPLPAILIGATVLAWSPHSLLLVLLGGVAWWKVGPGAGVYVMALGAWPDARLLDLAFPASLALARWIREDRVLLVAHCLILGFVTALFVKGLFP